MVSGGLSETNQLATRMKGFRIGNWRRALTQARLDAR
jgi:hypothetical protein